MSARRAGIWAFHLVAAAAGVWWGTALFDALTR